MEDIKRWSNIGPVFLEGENRSNKREKIFEKIMAEFF